MRTRTACVFAATVLLFAVACGDSETEATGSGSPAGTGAGTSSNGGSGASTTSAGGNGGTGATTTSTGGGGMTGTGGGGMAAFALTSPAFMEGMMIPDVHTCVGTDISPQLDWGAGPPTTMSYAVVMRDLDFPPGGGGFLHWVIWDIPASAMGLPEDVEQNSFLPMNVAGAMQSRNFQGGIGFAGSCSGMSINTYEFTVHAMGEMTLGFAVDTNGDTAADYIELNSVASTSLSGEH